MEITKKKMYQIRDKTPYGYIDINKDNDLVHMVEANSLQEAFLIASLTPGKWFGQEMKGGPWKWYTNDEGEIGSHEEYEIVVKEVIEPPHPLKKPVRAILLLPVILFSLPAICFLVWSLLPAAGIVAGLWSIIILFIWAFSRMSLRGTIKKWKLSLWVALIITPITTGISWFDRALWCYHQMLDVYQTIIHWF